MAARYAVFWGCQIPARLPFLEKSIRMVMEKLGVELVDLPGFTCCPEPNLVKNYSEDAWLIAAARNLAVAEASGLTLLTPCNGCYSTLKSALGMIRDAVDTRERVAALLEKVGLQLQGHLKVKHLIEVLHDDIGPGKIKSLVRQPMNGMKIAVHYGCHMLRPSRYLRFDDPLQPAKYDALVQALGAESPDYDGKMHCCGSSLSFAGQPGEADRLLRKKLLEVKERADALTVVCPACYIQFEHRQYVLQRQSSDLGVPVFTYPELLGLALGLSPEELGLKEHRISTQGFLDTWRHRSGALDQVKQRIDLASLERCYNCGACLDDCPVALANERFQPREIMGRLLRGEVDGLLEEPAIWECLECHTCSEMCPQKFGMERVFTMLKGLAVERGRQPLPLQNGLKGFLKTGRLGAADVRARRKLGLEDLPAGGEEELRRLLDLLQEEKHSIPKQS